MNEKVLRITFQLPSLGMLTNCGGSSGGGSDDPTDPGDDPNASITIDGTKDAAYTDISTGNSGWGATFGSLSTYSDGTYLYVYFNFTAVPGANNVYLFIDDTTISTGSNPASTDCTGWGALSAGLNTFTNTAAINVDFSAVGWVSDGNGTNPTAGTCTLGNVRSLVSEAPTDKSTVCTFAQSTDFAGYEFKIPYSAIGSASASGNSLKIIVMFGKNGYVVTGNESGTPTPGWGGIHATIPAETMDSTNGYMTDISSTASVTLN